MLFSDNDNKRQRNDDGGSKKENKRNAKNMIHDMKLVAKSLIESKEKLLKNEDEGPFYFILIKNG